MYNELKSEVEVLKNELDEMTAELEKAVEKGNKAAMRRFRTKSSVVTKKLKELRKLSLDAEKQDNSAK